MGNAAKVRLAHFKRSDKRRRPQRGQSLVEFALSVTVLILLFSGLVDLGRAYFVKILLDSAVSEGAHWAAAYPGCIQYGTAYNETGAENVPPECRGTNSIRGRIISETIQLSCENISNTELVPEDPATRLDQIVEGDTVTLRITYQMPVLTPIVQAIVGGNLTLGSETKEVVRGDTLPSTEGDPMPHCGPTPLTQPVAHLSQSPAACTNGQATLQWDSQGDAVTGYHVYSVVGSTKTLLAGTRTQMTPPDSSGTIPYGMAPGLGGLVQVLVPPPSPDNMINGVNQLYSVNAFVSDGTNTEDSLDTTFTAICKAVQPKNLAAACNVGNTGANFTFTMDTPIDLAVTGYRISQTAPLSKTMGTISGAGSGNTTGSASFAAGSGDWKATYQIQAVDSGDTPIGAASSVDLDCTYNTPITVNVDDGLATYTHSSNLTYAITVSNPSASGNPARGITITDDVGLGTPVSWQCTSPSCASNAVVTGALNTMVDIPPGTSYTFSVIVQAPASGVAPVINTVTLSTPGGCPTTGLGCIINVSGTTSDTDTYSMGSADLTLTNPVHSPDQYKDGEPVSFTFTATNPSTLDAIGATIQDTLPSSLTGPFSYSCTASAGSTCSGSFTGNIFNGVMDLAANGGTATYTVTGTVVTGTIGLITNTANLYPPAVLTDPTMPNMVTDSVSRYPTADLAITNTASASAYNPGDTITFTMDVTSPAGADNVVGASLTIDFPPTLIINSGSWACTVVSGSGQCPTSFTPIGQSVKVNFDIAASSTLRFTLTGTAPSGIDTLINSASVSVPSTVSDPNLANNAASAQVVAAGAPPTDVTIDSIDDGLPLHTYQVSSSAIQITYTIVVKNIHPSQAATNAHVTNVVSARTASQWQCTSATGGATCPSGDTVWKDGLIDSTIANMPVGSTVTYTQKVTIAALTASVTDTATVTAPGDTNNANDSRSLTSNARPDMMVVSVTSGQPYYQAPTSLTYTIVVANIGIVPVPAGAVLTNVINTSGVTPGNWACTGGSGVACPTGSSGSGTNSNINSTLPVMPVGSSLTYTQTVNIAGTVTSVVTDTVSVNVANENTPANNTLTDPGTSPYANMTIVSVGHAGSTIFTAPTSITYTIVVKNTGPVTVGIAVLTNSVSAGTATNWQCVSGSGTACPTGGNGSGSGTINSTINSIPANASLTYTQTVSIPAGTTSVTDTATVRVYSMPTDGNASDDQSTSVPDTSAPDIRLASITDNRATYAPNTIWNYTITVANAGGAPITNATLAVTLPGISGLNAVNWQCITGAGGAMCPDTGSHPGLLNTTISSTMPAGSTLTYRQTVQTAPIATATNGLTRSITVSAAVNVTGDGNPANNTGQDVDQVAPITNFRGGNCHYNGGNWRAIILFWSPYVWPGATKFVITDTNTNTVKTIFNPGATSYEFVDNKTLSGHVFRIEAFVGSTLIDGSAATFTAPNPCP